MPILEIKLFKNFYIKICITKLLILAIDLTRKRKSENNNNRKIYEKVGVIRNISSPLLFNKKI